MSRGFTCAYSPRYSQLLKLQLVFDDFENIDCVHCIVMASKCVCGWGEEFDDVASVLNPSPNAKIHGVIMTISPVKKDKTCSFFNW